MEISEEMMSGCGSKYPDEKVARVSRKPTRGTLQRQAGSPSNSDTVDGVH
jgi:hypothetical protein